MMNGLDEFTRSLREAQETIEKLDGDLATVRFGPEDPASIEAAVQEMERVIDERVGRHANNPIVAPLVAGAKERFRQVILDKAAAARAGEELDEANEGDAGED
jgi:hypothetical protein